MSVLHAAIDPAGPVKNLVCLTTPIDFRPMRLFKVWTDPRYLELDRLVETLGNVPPELVNVVFEMLRPASTVMSTAQFWDNVWSADYVHSHRLMHRWAYDALPIAAAYFREGIRELFWENSLYQHRLTLAGRRADLRRIIVPLFHGVATHDHIAPREATRPLMELVGSRDKHEAVITGGDLSVVAGRDAVRRLWAASGFLARPALHLSC